MLNKKFLCGLVALSCMALSPADSSAASIGNSVNIYGGFSGAGQFAFAKDVSLVGTTTAKIQGEDKDSAYKDGYKPDYSIGYMGSAHVGMIPFNPLRAEVEFSYASIGVSTSGDNKNDKNFQVTDGSKIAKYEHKGLSHMAGLLNVYYDIPGLFASIDIAPYVGIGGGLARITFDEVSRFTFAYQGKAGVTVGIPGTAARFVLGGKVLGALDGSNGFEKVKSGTNVYNIVVPYLSYGFDVGIILSFSA